MILGLSGYARSGKDEAAKVLVEEFGFERIAFADKLRDFLYALNPDVMEDGVVYGQARALSEVIDKFGWDGYKWSPWKDSIRGLLQRLGTEAGRNVLWDSIWIDAAFAGKPDDGNYVVTDVRFPNEADAVRQRAGGVLWRINRAGVGPANQHASETSLDDYKEFAQHINNNGTLEEFHGKVSRAGARWLERLGT